MMVLNLHVFEAWSAESQHYHFLQHYYLWMGWVKYPGPLKECKEKLMASGGMASSRESSCETNLSYFRFWYKYVSVEIVFHHYLGQLLHPPHLHPQIGHRRHLQIRSHQSLIHYLNHLPQIEFHDFLSGRPVI